MKRFVAGADRGQDLYESVLNRTVRVPILIRNPKLPGLLSAIAESNLASATERRAALPSIKEADMCSKCDEIIATIARYRRLKTQITDQQMNEAAERQLTKLEADKLALHPKK